MQQEKGQPGPEKRNKGEMEMGGGALRGKLWRKEVEVVRESQGQGE